MRLRNVKNKDEILNNSKILVKNPYECINNWKKVFDNNNPIEIEIGCGKGNFIINKALQNPSINFVGIEKYDSVLARALEKVDYEIDNLKFIRLDALNVDQVFNKEVSCIYLNFSDPWPKKRHSERRLTSKKFLEKYDNLFINEKIIIQKTDNVSLYEYSVVSLNSYGYKIVEMSLDLHKSEFNNNNVMTEYEEKFSKKGIKINYLLAKK